MRDPKMLLQYISLLGEHICLLHINTNIINNLSNTVLMDYLNYQSIIILR